jgi:hypothetical protein
MTKEERIKGTSSLAECGFQEGSGVSHWNEVEVALIYF